MMGIKSLTDLMDYALVNYKKIDWSFEEVDGGMIGVTIKDNDGGKNVRYVSRNDLEDIVEIMKIVLENA